MQVEDMNGNSIGWKEMSKWKYDVKEKMGFANLMTSWKYDAPTSVLMVKVDDIFRL